MHTINRHGVRIHYNGDYSGNVIICDISTSREMVVPFVALMELVADYVRSKRIAVIEQQDAAAILG